MDRLSTATLLILTAAASVWLTSVVQGKEKDLGVVINIRFKSENVFDKEAKLSELLEEKDLHYFSKDCLEQPVIPQRLNSQTFKVRGDHVSDKMANCLRGDIAVAMNVPEFLIVENENDTFSESNIKREMLQRLQDSCADCQFLLLHEITLPEAPAKDEEWRIALENKTLTNSVLFKLEISRMGLLIRRHWLNQKIEITKELPVAVKLIGSGQRITSSDFEYRTVRLDILRDGVPTKEHLIGRRIKRPLKLNEPIWSRFLEPVYLVEKGAPVSAIYQSSKMKVELKTVSKSSGQIGDWVNVASPSGASVLKAKVIGEGLVEVL
ncbi:MAG: flagella basal body P-ring formation protein FlgA [Bdellovibrionales bacterium CG10_big_fil_rev_8_21_14_0_10_45_34]|nr:MAG: flagella basal body P-ring formation protein FlgA [Bdellovibrionales bacterium CG10_big_fil_rev_8_21_14_0_10_45_34]